MITFKVEADNIEQIKQFSDEAVARALEQCGAVWENNAKGLAPVDTGRLRNSIEHHPEGNDTVVVETNVEYAGYQELGTFVHVFVRFLAYFLLKQLQMAQLHRDFFQYILLVFYGKQS